MSQPSPLTDRRFVMPGTVVKVDLYPQEYNPPNDTRSPLEWIAFQCMLIFVFLRFSYLHEVFYSQTGVNTYVLYFFSPAAILAVIFDGGLRRTFREKAPLFWLGFAGWMLVAVPFSYWQGGSFTHVTSYIKTDFVMLPIIVGLARTWGDCKKLMHTIACAAVVDVAVSYLLGSQMGAERLSLGGEGTIGNSNDLAAHLLLILPFVLFVILEPGTRFLLRAFLIATLILGMFAILRTASRGALLALVAVMIFLLLRGSLRQRMAIGLTTIVATVILITFLPADTWQRLTSFSESADSSQEALESQYQRENLINDSIKYTFEHPIVGIGPAQFPNYGNQDRYSNDTSWRAAHNSYLQISSECGIPALIFYLAAIISTVGLLVRIGKHVTGTALKDVTIATYCLTISTIGYCVSTFFVNFGYTFEYLAISALITATWCAVRAKPETPQSSFS